MATKAKRETSAEILRGIARDLKAGHEFGKWERGRVCEYFWRVLSFGHCSVSGRPIWRWCNFGSSANPASLKDLAWIIRVIFKMTPGEFRKAYEMV